MRAGARLRRTDVAGKVTWRGQASVSETAAVCLLCGLAALGAPQAFAAEESAGAWGVVSASGPLGAASSTGRWNLAVDAQARYFDIGSGASQWLLRPSIGYGFANGVELRLGFGRFRARSRSGRVVDENRPWQQIGLRLGSPGGGTLDFRGRLEQRSIDISDETNHTFRAMLRYRHIVGSAGTRIEANVEAFLALNDTDWAGSTGLIQERVYLGASRPISSRARLEIGYLYQVLESEAAPDIGNHLAVVRFDYRFGD